jgi:hypothetical protein
MGINNYIGEFLVALGAVLMSAALLRLQQSRRAKIRNRIGAPIDEQHPIARWGLLTAGLLFLPAGFAMIFFR